MELRFAICVDVILLITGELIAATSEASSACKLEAVKLFIWSDVSDFTWAAVRALI